MADLMRQRYEIMRSQVAEADRILRAIIDACDPRGEGIDKYGSQLACEKADRWVQQNADLNKHWKAEEAKISG